MPSGAPGSGNALIRSKLDDIEPTAQYLFPLDLTSAFPRIFLPGTISSSSHSPAHLSI